MMAQINSIAKDASFSAVVRVAQRLGRCAVADPKSAAIVGIVDTIAPIIAEGFDPNEVYVIRVAYPEYIAPDPIYVYKNPRTPYDIRLSNVRRIRDDIPADAPFGKWCIAQAFGFTETAIAYPYRPESDDDDDNREGLNLLYSKVILINPNDGVLPLSVDPDDLWIIAVGMSFHDWRHIDRNIYALDDYEVDSISLEFFEGRRIGWRFRFDHPVEGSIDREVFFNYPPTPDELLDAFVKTGQIPRVTLEVV